MRRSATLCLIAGPAFTLSACQTTPGEYPSLAVRDVERMEGRFEPPLPSQLDVPEVPTDYSGTLDQRLATLAENARAAHARFLAARPAASRLAAAAAGSTIGSDAWASAQVALSDLDSIRSDTAVALADLDILAVAAAVQAEERAAIDATRADVLAMVTEEDDTLAELRARVR